MFYLCSKTKALISCVVAALLICAFVSTYGKSRFSHNVSHLAHVPNRLKTVTLIAILASYILEFLYRTLVSNCLGKKKMCRLIFAFDVCIKQVFPRCQTNFEIWFGFQCRWIILDR